MIPDDPMRPRPPRILLTAGAIADAVGLHARPGAVLAEGDRILAAGSPQSIGRVDDAQRRHEPQTLIIPALVNCHVHLDLTHIGPVPYDGDFTRWVDIVRMRRGTCDAEIAASVRLGVRLARAGGTAAVGDIAGAHSIVPTQVQRELGLAGVSFFEVFGVGRQAPAAVQAMEQAVHRVPCVESGVRHGLQPHAPYSCALEVYRAAAGMQRPLATHLAETPAELQFTDDATGPLADMLRRLGVWDSTIVGAGVHPVAHIVEALGDSPCVAAHLNYVDDAQISLLAGSRVSVAYCPRASIYFGHAGHRYRDMLDAGVTVALGTDSVLCLDTADRLSILDEMRLLFRRDATDPMLLLRMATVNGARALGIDPNQFLIRQGARAGLIGVRFDPADANDALAQALAHHEPPEWVLGPINGSNEWFQDADDASGAS